MSKGIDVEIDKLVAILNADLWDGLGYTAYGRCELTTRDGKTVPEFFATKEYTEMLLNDKVGGHSFFIMDDNVEVNGISEHIATVYLYFALDLKKLYPSVTATRATEYACEDIEYSLRSSYFRVTEIVRNKSAFNDFDVSYTDNMGYYFLLKYKLKINYSIIT